MGIFGRIKKKQDAKNKKESFYKIERIKEQERVKHVNIIYHITNKKRYVRYNIVQLDMDTKVVEKSSLGDIYFATVQWYQNTKENNGKTFALQDKETILLGVEIPYLDDAEYIKKLMGDLLEHNRIKQYIKEGLDKNPQTPCGNYIGELRKDTNKQYQKLFDLELGKKIHNSQAMIAKRREYEKLKEQVKGNCQREIRYL